VLVLVLVMMTHGAQSRWSGRILGVVTGERPVNSKVC
jgi:hypothetical protein